MNLSHHRMPRELFRALAAGGGGPDALRELASAQYSKHLLLVRGVLDAAAPGSDAAARTQAGYLLLAAAQRHDPAAATAVISHPAVGAWAQQVVRQARYGPGAVSPEMAGAPPDWLCAVAAAAAITAGMPAEIEVPVTAGLAVLPSLGAAEVTGPSAVVRVDERGAEVRGSGADGPGAAVRVPADPRQEAAGWQPMRRFTFGDRDLLIDDLDPFRMPALTALAPRLTAAESVQWAADIAQAWPVLREHHREAAAEIAAIASVIVPHATPAAGYSSSTTAETYGAIALSAPVDPWKTAESLIHETQHLKLFALMDIVTLLRPDDGRRYYAPWRPDPRPLAGLLQGAYAFLGVSAYWRRQRLVTGQGDEAALRAHTEYLKWRMATSRVVRTLHRSGRLTPAGQDFADGMAQTLTDWSDDQVPHQAEAAAIMAADRHQVRWEKENSRLAD
jgi:uncharacterized protein